MRKADETWDAWSPELGPSRDLHAAVYGKTGAPLPWSRFASRYRAEMKAQRARIAELAARARAGETITLLCSSACVDPDRCHRTLLAELIDND